MLLSQDGKIIDLNNNPEKFTSCKAIYVASGAAKVLKPEIAKFSKNKILTIAIFDGFTEIGGMVQVQMWRRNFELILNSKAMKEAGIRLNSLAMSLVVN